MTEITNPREIRKVAAKEAVFSSQRAYENSVHQMFLFEDVVADPSAVEIGNGDALREIIQARLTHLKAVESLHSAEERSGASIDPAHSKMVWDCENALAFIDGDRSSSRGLVNVVGAVAATARHISEQETTLTVAQYLKRKKEPGSAKLDDYRSRLGTPVYTKINKAIKLHGNHMGAIDAIGAKIHQWIGGREAALQAKG